MLKQVSRANYILIYYSTFQRYNSENIVTTKSVSNIIYVSKLETVFYKDIIEKITCNKCINQCDWSTERVKTSCSDYVRTRKIKVSEVMDICSMKLRILLYLFYAT